MGKYKIFTTITDTGAYITKLVLKLPCEIGKNDIGIHTFNVYVERKNIQTGEILMSGYIYERERPMQPAKGYQSVLKTYPSDFESTEVVRGTFATLELKEEMLGKRIEGSILTSDYINNDYRITLLHELQGEESISGLVFDECVGDICPQLKGWANEENKKGKARLKYGFFSPDFEVLNNPKPDFFGKVTQPLSQKLPLVIWLHGAGEGGQDVRIPYTGNKVVNMSESVIQGKLGGAAWVLVPQCPTVWMDDGIEQLGHSNQSIYVEDLKACIDTFIKEHEAQIDQNRLYIGGGSNGGFMTIRMLIDYPDFFAAAFPTCEAFYEENITEDIVRKLKNIPIWFAHAKPDELVLPQETSIPMYKRLIEAGATNVHFSYFDHLEDLTGMYKDKKGRPQKFFNHGVWVHVYNDDCCMDFDGTLVMHDGVPVTLWGWMGKQTK